ncbi:MAG: hypothetical protein AAF830_15645 [Pseudomonadota bacterium]
MNAIERAVKRLPDVSTRAHFEAFLKERSIPHSADNWADLIDKRLRPAMQDGRVTAAELIRFYREMEEHGAQHVLLYGVKDRAVLKRLFQSDWTKTKFCARGDVPDLDAFLLPDGDADLSLYEIRYDRRGQYRTFVMKFCTIRQTVRFVGEEERPGSRFARIYATEPYQAVNVIRICESGLCEVRLRSHKRNFGYQAEAHALVGLVPDVVTLDGLREISLSRIKDDAFDKAFHDDLPGAFRLRHSRLSEVDGPTLELSMGALDRGLLDSKYVVDGLNAFRRSSDVRTDRVGFWLVQEAGEDEAPTVIKIELTDVLNEFAVSRQVDVIHYEAILDILLKDGLETSKR